MITLQDVPRGYAHCFAGLNSCPKADNCLRAIAAKLLTESKDAQPQTINTVNAIYIGQLTDLGSCALYRSSEPIRYAKGMTHLFEDIPLKLSKNVRRWVTACFSCESYFYHSRSGKRLITPAEQQKIARVFRSVNLNMDPKYDGYEEEIVW